MNNKTFRNLYIKALLFNEADHDRNELTQCMHTQPFYPLSQVTYRPFLQLAYSQIGKECVNITVPLH